MVSMVCKCNNLYFLYIIDGCVVHLERFINSAHVYVFVKSSCSEWLLDSFNNNCVQVLLYIAAYHYIYNYNVKAW